MTAQTLERANQLRAAITALEEGIKVTTFAIANKKPFRLSIPGNSNFVDISTFFPDQAAVITGIKVSLEVHLDSCRKELEKL